MHFTTHLNRYVFSCFVFEQQSLYSNNDLVLHTLSHISVVDAYGPHEIHNSHRNFHKERATVGA